MKKLTGPEVTLLNAVQPPEPYDRVAISSSTAEYAVQSLRKLFPISILACAMIKFIDSACGS